MKKINKYTSIVLTIISLFVLITACSDGIEDLGKKEKPVLTANGPTNITISEGSDAVLKFKLSKAINKPIQYRLVILNDESTATDQDDYIIPGCISNDPDCIAIEENGGPVGFIFEIPEYTTEYEVNIKTIFDDLVEVPETIKLKVISNRTLLGTVDELYYSVNINNSASNDLSIRFNWDGTFMSGGIEVDFCDIDMDLELYDSSDNIIDDSYSNCPESLLLNSSTLADGTYKLIASLWTTDDYSENINIPAFITFIKQGTSFNSTYNLSTFFPMQDGGIDDGNPDAFVEYTIIKNGTTYTINNTTVTTASQSRLSGNKNNKSKKSKKSKKIELINLTSPR